MGDVPAAAVVAWLAIQRSRIAWQPTLTAISPVEIEYARDRIRVGLRQERPRASIRRSEGAATPGTEPSMSAVQSHKSRIRQSWPA